MRDFAGLALAEPANWMIGGRAKKGEQAGEDFGHGPWNASSAMQPTAPFMRMTSLRGGGGEHGSSTAQQRSAEQSRAEQHDAARPACDGTLWTVHRRRASLWTGDRLPLRSGSAALAAAGALASRSRTLSGQGAPARARVCDPMSWDFGRYRPAGMEPSLATPYRNRASLRECSSLR